MAQHDVAFRNRPGIKGLLSDGKGHDIGRMGDHDRIDMGMLFIDVSVQRNRAAGYFAGFHHAVVNADEILFVKVFSIQTVRGYKEAVFSQPL